jgi:ubiquinone/menaquinone biosynthesis C-methylase UbiE
MMQLQSNHELPQTNDFELISQHLPTDDATLLELGCGAALTTRRLAESLPIRRIVAMEVDRVQHEKNLLITDLDNVEFSLGGAEATGLPDASVDAVIMLKSLHHVPVHLMDQALSEIARVLKAGGIAYISEPVYAGEFNEILKLFNDEQRVREAAFAAIERATQQGPLSLLEEVHFLSESRFDSFKEFEQRILGATHSEFDVSPDLHAEVKRRFLQHTDADGAAVFSNPMRADLLLKPA